MFVKAAFNENRDNFSCNRRDQSSPQSVKFGLKFLHLFKRQFSVANDD